MTFIKVPIDARSFKQPTDLHSFGISLYYGALYFFFLSFCPIYLCSLYNFIVAEDFSVRKPFTCRQYSIRQFHANIRVWVKKRDRLYYSLRFGEKRSNNVLCWRRMCYYKTNYVTLIVRKVKCSWCSKNTVILKKSMLGLEIILTIDY